MIRRIFTSKTCGRIRCLFGLASVIAALALSPSQASAAQSVSMHCGNPVGYCQWGYNTTSPGVNEFITGTYNYWYDSYIDKNSGGRIGHGWNTASGCFDFLDGQVDYAHFFPSTTGSGCGGYLQRFLQYVSGAQSYLWFDSCAPQSGLCGGEAPQGAPAAAPKGADTVDSRSGGVEARGLEVAVTAGDFWALQRLSQFGQSLEEVLLLSGQNSRVFYRVTNRAGADCYALGPVLPTERRLERIQCAPEFPSRIRPVLDFTTLKQTSSDPDSARVWRSEGIVSDSVADIAFQTPGGELVGLTRVVDNAYSVNPVPPMRVTAIVARDRTGMVIWREPFTPISLPQ